MWRVLVVSDDPAIREDLVQGAQCLPDVEVAACGTLAEVAPVLESNPKDLLVVDLAMDAERGIDLVLAVRHAMPEMPIVAVTDMKVRDYDRQAMKLGVCGFIVKPIRVEHVQFQIEHAREIKRTNEQNAALRSAVQTRSEFGEIVGVSTEIRNVFELVRRAGNSAAPVALYGESGTGKELVAKAVHNASARRNGPFVCVNPSAMPEALLESELFGHARGAFTGAIADRKGYVELADRGTLFLDEIGDLPLSLQGKLLRVLQERTISRVGTAKPIVVDFRLITATNRDLMAEVNAGRFREDLFYRIHVYPIYLPPLRSRRSDIPILAEHFLRKYAVSSGLSIPGFALAGLEIMQAYSWPGNVRELENVVNRLVALKTDSTEISLAEVSSVLRVKDPLPMNSPAGTHSSRPRDIRPLGEYVREYVQWVLSELGGNKSRAARALGVDRATLQRKLDYRG